MGPGTAVYYCYRVRNTGDVAFNMHDLVDDRLGTLLNGFPFLLAPGDATSVISDPVIIQGTVVNVGTWTAFNAVDAASQNLDLRVPAQIGQVLQQASATSSATVNCVAADPYLQTCRPAIRVPD